MKEIVLVVPREAAGARLDRFLAGALAGAAVGDHAPSRSELQRWIDHGGVSVDGVSRKAGDKLKEGARVTVQPEPPPKTEAVPEDGIAFEVVHEDDQILVIDKPAGLVVHPARGHRSGTLVNGLLARGVFDATELARERGAHDGAEDPSGHLRPGIVHRLDKGTSGLLVVARTARAREHLKTQFAAHSIDREYVALCVGEASSQTIASLHGRHPTDRLRFSSKVKDGKRAVTHVTLLERFGRAGVASMVSCRLETGRTHQIRVHLAEHVKAPILGDALYGKTPKHDVLREEAETLGRPALHARVLGFVHPTTRKKIRFEAEPPSDFQLAVATLRAIP